MKNRRRIYDTFKSNVGIFILIRNLLKMAFYNRRMAQNKAITKAWGAAHRNKVNRNEEINLPDICSEIGRWMRRDRRPRSRLSLRSFSVLLSGTIRLYNDQVNRLLKDTFDCSIYPVPTRTVLVTSDQTMRHSGSSSEESPELVPEIYGNNTSANGNRSESESTEYNTDTESLPFEDLYGTTPDESTVFTVTPNSGEQTNTDEEEKHEKTRDQIIQTSPTPGSAFTGFDPNLPFGYIIVHDNFDSRIPSKILFSSLSENIKFLPIRRPMN